MTVWLDGTLRAADEVRIDPADRGFTLGDGVFETMAVAADGAVRHLSAHLARLRGGAGLLGIPLVDDAVLTGAVMAVVEANGTRGGSVRVTVTRGPAARGLAVPEVVAPTLLVTAGAGAGVRGAVRAVTSRTACRNPGSPLSRIKPLGYLDAILALREAGLRGGDEALLGDGAGRLACATTANLFLVERGRLATPRIENGAMPGLRRARLLALGGGIERSVVPAALFRAECVFLSNSLGLRAVASVDGRSVERDDALVERLARLTA